MEKFSRLPPEPARDMSSSSPPSPAILKYRKRVARIKEYVAHVGRKIARAKAASIHPPAQPDCPSCLEYRKLINGAADTILKHQSKLRSLHSWMDGQSNLALRESQGFETLCRLDSFHDEIPDRKALKKMCKQIWEDAIPDPVTDGVDQPALEAKSRLVLFRPNLPTAVVPQSAPPDAASDPEPLEDFNDLEDDEMGLDSSSAGSVTGTGEGSAVSIN